MKERPIIFSGEMVRAILKGRKTQKRRVINPQPLPWCTQFAVSPTDLCPNTGKPGDWIQADDSWYSVRGLGRCPYGQPSDRLWVRETWWADDADGLCIFYAATDARSDIPLKPSIFMPRKWSRITLEIVNIGVERLQDISDEDAISEGIPLVTDPDCPPAKVRFAALWGSINAKRGYPWLSNPWVWVITFRRIQT